MSMYFRWNRIDWLNPGARVDSTHEVYLHLPIYVSAFPECNGLQRTSLLFVFWSSDGLENILR